ncbi:MAG: hypothetical protein Q9218_002615 [Villophora microphyllina]
MAWVENLSRYRNRDIYLTDPFRFLDLPYELRIHTLSFLLPDRAVIGCDSYCHTQILHANKQLYKEGTNYLYRLKTFEIKIGNCARAAYDFLGEPLPLNKLPPLPYHEMKEFVIRVEANCSRSFIGNRMRDNRLRLCTLLKQHHVKFRKLKIVFSGSLWATTGLDEAMWIAMSQSALTYPSTFAFVMAPLYLIPAAKECTIELPEGMRLRPGIVRDVESCRRRLDGTDVLDDEETLHHVILAEFDGLRYIPCAGMDGAIKIFATPIHARGVKKSSYT